MTVTVIVSTYNHKNVIGQALESVLQQDVDCPMEVVVLDDYSIDGTRAILQDYRRNHPDVIRLVLEERNLNDNRRLVREIQECRSDYIALLDGDDFWNSPHKLRRQMTFLDVHPECVMCSHRYVLVQDGVTGHEPYPLDAGDGERISGIENLLAGCNMLYSTSVLRGRLQVEFPEWFFGHACADWFMFLLYAQHGQIGYLPEIMGSYRLGGLWTSLDEPERMKQVIEHYDIVIANFDRAYIRPLRLFRSNSCFFLAREYGDRGNRVQAVRWLIESLRTRPWCRIPHPHEIRGVCSFLKSLLTAPFRVK